MKRVLQAQNEEGYINSSSKVNTSGEITKGVNIKQALRDGAPNSSKANINIARFDTVPLMRHFDNNNWFGKSTREDN